MDFWAAMEHRISYKKEYDNREQRVAELLSYADTLVDMEKEFEKYNENATLSWIYQQIGIFPFKNVSDVRRMLHFLRFYNKKQTAKSNPKSLSVF